MNEAVLSLDLPLALADFAKSPRLYLRVKWITPKWDWIDPYKDRMAELLAVKSGFKSKSDVVEAEGYDPEENDARIAADKAREAALGLVFSESQFANPLAFSLSKSLSQD
jgi:capsid protein